MSDGKSHYTTLKHSWWNLSSIILVTIHHTLKPSSDKVVNSITSNSMMQNQHVAKVLTYYFFIKN